MLHTANVLALPVIGSLLTASRRSEHRGGAPDGSPPTISTPPLGPGTWVLRIEAASGARPDAAPDDIASSGSEPAT